MSIKNLFVDAYMFLCRVLYGFDNSKVLFESFHGKSYSDNPKAISEALYRSSKEVKIVWVTQNTSNATGTFPEYVKFVHANNRWAFYKELATASVFVTNFQLPNIRKSKRQFFIQTWHGDRAFKKVLHDSEFVSNATKLPEEIDGFCNLAIAGSDYGEMQYRSAFQYKGTILKEGTPRNDLLVACSDRKIQEIRKTLGVDENTKILLYAPTLRRKACAEHTQQEIKDIDIASTLSALERKYNCKWVCFARAHSAVCGLAGVSISEKIMDMSSYEDMADLLLISDMLITDYSSCSGDFALLDRAIILFQSDFEDYLQNDRELYFSMEDSPYYVAKSQCELEQIIQNLNEESIVKNCHDILTFYGTNETGHASETVAECITNWISKLK